MADLFPALFDQGGELVTNGTFDTDASGWTSGGNSTLSAVAGRLRITFTASTGTTTARSTAIPTVVGQRYHATGNSFAGTAHGRGFRVGNTPFGSQYATVSDSDLDLTFTATSTTAYIVCTMAADLNEYAEFDNISLKREPFFAPTVQPGIAPGLLTNTQTFHAATVAPSLAPPLLSNSQSHYAPTITATVQPGLLTNTNTFHSPTTGAPDTLLPPLVARTLLFDTDVFDSALFDTGEEILEPTVTAGAVTLSPSLFTNEQTFFAGEVPPPQELTPELLLNNPPIYLPGVWGAPVVGGPSWAEDAPDDASWSAVTPGSASWATGNTGSSLWTPVIPGEGSWA